MRDEEDEALRTVAFRNAESILQARHRAENDLFAAKEALSETAGRLRLALDAGELGDWSWEARTDEVTLGARAASIFAMPSDQRVTWAAMRAKLHEDDRERARLAVETSLATRTDYDIEYRVIHANGDARWVSAKGRGVYARDGEVRGMTGVVQDITERKRNEDALRDKTRVLEILNGTGKLMASSLDLPVLVQAVTDAATELTGAEVGAFFYNTSGKAGDAFTLFSFSGASRETFAPENASCTAGPPAFEGRAPIRCGDARRDPHYRDQAPFGVPCDRAQSYLAVPVVSRDGSLIGGLFFGHSETNVFTERTERLIAGVAGQAAMAIDNARLYDDARRLAAQREKLVEGERIARLEVERVSHMKDEFLATLSHELRTPLNAILGWAQLLLSNESPMDVRRGLETIARNARAQTQLIDDLLDMSRIISGKVRLDVQPTDLGEVVLAAVEAVKPSAEAKGIRLSTIVDPQAGRVSGDPNRLQQVVWNLLSNSMKFTPKGGSVEVLVERVSSHIELTVHDSGIGISPDFLPNVFDRFRQADASSTRVHGGLGLGLSIVKQIVELHGGSTHAHSGGAGQGATFTVTLPLAPVRTTGTREHPGSARSLPSDCDEVDLDGVKVLVVDDERDACELIDFVLTRCGARVTTARSAAEALVFLERDRPDVIVSDIGMPGEDGYKLIRDIRALPKPRGGQTPAVALTAFARSEDRTRAMMAGYQIHIAKPIEPRELVVTVGSLAGRTGRTAS